MNFSTNTTPKMEISSLICYAEMDSGLQNPLRAKRPCATLIQPLCAVGFGLVGFSSAATSLERRSAIGDAESGGHAVGHAITKWSSYQPDIRREVRYYYVVTCYVGPLTTYSIIQFCDENYLTFVMHAPFRQVFENMPAWRVFHANHRRRRERQRGVGGVVFPVADADDDFEMFAGTIPTIYVNQT